MNVRPQAVKQLRAQTGAGMGDCKNALIEAAGDFAAAEKLLKKQGLASAARRSDRQTSEGAVFFAQNAERLVMVEILCETDFVAMNEEFRKLGEAVARQAVAAVPAENLQATVQEGVLVLKESLKLGRIASIAAGPGQTIGTYSHNNGAIGAAVVLHSEGGGEEGGENLAKLGRELAMHAAAFQPLYRDSSQVAAEIIAEQQEIFRARAQQDNIPAKARDGYLKGQMKKWLAECCFLEQGFVKEPKRAVSAILQDFSKQTGLAVTLQDYKIIKVGA